MLIFPFLTHRIFEIGISTLLPVGIQMRKSKMNVNINPGLDRTLVEHRLQIKKGHRPYK